MEEENNNVVGTPNWETPVYDTEPMRLGKFSLLFVTKDNATLTMEFEPNEMCRKQKIDFLDVKYIEVSSSSLPIIQIYEKLNEAPLVLKQIEGDVLIRDNVTQIMFNHAVTGSIVFI